MHRPHALLAIAFLVSAASARAQSPDLTALLQRPVIDPSIPLAEVQAYCEGRIITMPAVKTLAEWETFASKTRQEVLDKVVFCGAAAQQWRDAKTKVEWLDTIEGGPGYAIKKVRYEILPGLWTVGLLYEPTQIAGKIPVHLAVNGHDGNGKAAPYKQLRCINLAKRGVASLNVEWLGMGQLRAPDFTHARMNQLDLCGASGLAPFYLAMSRGIDVLLALPYADPQRLAVSGLSGGGWQTIVISSLDPRVKLANPVAGYSSFRTRARFPTDLGDSEQTPTDLGAVADYNQLTALLAGRSALLTYNAKDNCCFASAHALAPLEEAARPIFALYGQPERLRTHVNFVPGNHNFEVDNRQAFYSILGDTFFPGDKTFSAREIPSEAEVKKAEQLSVPLPEDNLDLHKLAVALSKDLPRSAKLEPEPARAKLSELVSYFKYSAAEQSFGTPQDRAGVKATFSKLRIGDVWTIPAVELTRGEPSETVLVVADTGRKGAAAEIEEAPR